MSLQHALSYCVHKNVDTQREKLKMTVWQYTLALTVFILCLLSSVKDSCQKPACYEKTVTLTKEPYDSLGMTVAGGMSSRGWDLPIYVTNVDPDGVVGQEGSIRKGKMSV